MTDKTSILRVFVIGLLLTALASSPLHAQDEESEDQKLFLSGYLKEMLIADFGNDRPNFWTNLIHNRMNLKWYPNSNFSGFLELRTRHYIGDYVELVPGFKANLDATEDFFDLSWTIIDDRNSVLHTMIDRAYIQYRKEKWEVSLGRQRVNWGINLAWNPNDLFNAYSYFDFDYEERPGSDALRVQRYFGFASSIDFAVNIAEDPQDFVAAGRWGTNRWNYDFQLIGGFARNDVAIGGGWAGNIKTSGFKGEFTYFSPVNDNPLDPALIGTLSWDYSFLSGFYLNISYLFNSVGDANLGVEGFAQVFTGQLTARNLTPYKHSAFIQSSYPFHPLINGGLAIMAFPGSKGLFFSPFVTFSLYTNFDFDIIGQLYYDEFQNDWQSLTRAFNYRLKWSF